MGKIIIEDDDLTTTPIIPPEPVVREDYKLEEKPSWKNRRRVIFGTLIFCALTVCYLLYKGEDTKIAETGITMSFFLAGSVIGGYVFGATYETVGLGKYKK